MPDLEAVGDAATGAVLASVVEPRAGKEDGRTHEKNCLNCGTELVGGYCHACGQHAHVHRTLTALWHDLAHGVLHLDGKIWRTLPMLAWRPGELTRRYAHGERAKFVSPMALFLFSVFLMFAVFTLIGGPVVSSNTQVEGVQTGRARVESELERLAGCPMPTFGRCKRSVPASSRRVSRPWTWIRASGPRKMRSRSRNG